MEVTESDKNIMQIIKKLTEQAEGKPPTLAEIALAAGLQSSSRANIQRQLTRLRPTYVDWNSSARSIHLTETGLAILELAFKPGNSFITGLPASGAIPGLLASGLTKLTTTRIDKGKPLQAPYPKEWQRGLNILTAECLERDLPPPDQMAIIIDWCKKPLDKWQLKFSGYERGYTEALLDEEERPTNFCLELALEIKGGNAELEISQKLMAGVRSKANVLRRQEAYVALRRFLIEHPVITEREQLDAALRPEFDPFDSELYDMYEAVPTQTIENRQIQLCGFCGWTLVTNSHTGRLHCGDDRCRLLTANFTRHSHQIIVEPNQAYLRVKRAIRRYIVAPGIYEVNVFKRLESAGLKVTLWHDYDSYDLRISFGDGEHWAVDIKDWQNPFLLLKKLGQISPTDYTKAFYVIPDERIQEDKGYLTLLRNATVNQPFELLSISELIQKVLQHHRNIEGGHPDA